MKFYDGLNYGKMTADVDVISWDSYPTWHQGGSDIDLAAETAFCHDSFRSMKGGKPFMVMESTPSVVNWQPYARLKRPGMHLLSSLQAVAHGSDTVQYFQWRKNRGSWEKLHGAVVDHVGHERTRVFEDVVEVGRVLEKLDAVVGSAARPDVAVLFDQENRWALADAQGLMSGDKGYIPTAVGHYKAFWKQGIPVDILDMEQSLDGYKLVIAPMLYMLRAGIAEKITRFVENGGTFVATYVTGLVDEHDLCFLGGFPGPLRPVLGLWAEEIDTLTPADSNTLVPNINNALGLTSSYAIRDLAERIHPEGAEVLATYGSDFYAGMPTLTVNPFGKGKAYYVAARTEQSFLDDFYRALAAQVGVEPILSTAIPEGVSVAKRSDGETNFVFVMNFNDQPTSVALDRADYVDMLTGETAERQIELGAYGLRILRSAV
jgi:beta-galactosidase